MVQKRHLDCFRWHIISVLITAFIRQLIIIVNGLRGYSSQMLHSETLTDVIYHIRGVLMTATASAVEQTVAAIIIPVV